ncbi:MAG: hypothetical protein JXN61_05075 [Sedimentisphaerales bacterium]|nr:hypothetical protein [Sedimentisphaerales bacterium]
MGVPNLKVVTGPRMLPIVHYGRTAYFADLRLGQFRDIENPHNFIDFDTDQGRLMCKQVGVILCPECRMSVIVSKAFEQERLRCMQCQNILGPIRSE